MANSIENGKIIFGYMAMMLESHDPWNPNTVYHRNRVCPDENYNWWVSKKSTDEAPNVNHAIPGFDSNGKPVASDWWALWIDWEHPMARLEAAMNDALAAAGNANSKAEQAHQAAERANSLDLVDLDGRIDILENVVSEIKSDDLVKIRQSIKALQDLVEVDTDSAINKFKEIVRFLSGIGSSSSLEGLLNDIAQEIARKQDAGDYATNERVDQLDEKIKRYAVPRFESDVLTFPAENGAYFENDDLILTV